MLFLTPNQQRQSTEDKTGKLRTVISVLSVRCTKLELGPNAGSSLVAERCRKVPKTPVIRAARR